MAIRPPAARLLPRARERVRAPRNRPACRSQYNDTTEEGVCFIPHPPSLQHEPPIECYKVKLAKPNPTEAKHTAKHEEDKPTEANNEKRKHEPATEIRQLLTKSDMGGEDGNFTKAEAGEWLALLAVHETGRLHSNALPHLPHTQTVPQDDFSKRWIGPDDDVKHTFSGTPRLLLPMLKDMMRYDRPLITWDIFGEPPPASWPNPMRGAGSSKFDEFAVARAAKKPRRDAAEANTVVHNLNPANVQERAEKDLLNMRWAEDLPGHVSSLKDGGFYLVKLDKGTGGEPWMAMGVVQARQLDGKQHFYWFGRSSQGTNPWPSTVTFRPWPGPGACQEHHPADKDEAICEITSEWMPAGHELNEKVFTLNSEYRKRVELFARLHDLVNDEAIRKKAPKKGPGKGPAPTARDTARPAAATPSGPDIRPKRAAPGKANVATRASGEKRGAQPQEGRQKAARVRRK